MSDFEREERYIVIKLSKLSARDAHEIKQRLSEMGRSSALTESVVVESDWPNYEDVWKSVEQVAKGEYKNESGRLLSTYGDGWYDGFLAAKELSENHDLDDYDNDAIMSMSEHAESESKIAKSA